MYKENISRPRRPPPTTEKFAATQLQSPSQLLLFLRQSVMSSTQLREGQKTFVGKRTPTEEEWGNVTFCPLDLQRKKVEECPLTNKREKYINMENISVSHSRLDVPYCVCQKHKTNTKKKPQNKSLILCIKRTEDCGRRP